MWQSQPGEGTLLRRKTWISGIERFWLWKERVERGPAGFLPGRCPPSGLWMAELRARLLQSAPSEYGFCSVGLICIWCLECLVMGRADALFWVMRAGVSNQCFSVYPVSSVIWVTSDCVAHLAEVLRASICKWGFCMPPNQQIIEWYEGENCSQMEILSLY